MRDYEYDEATISPESAGRLRDWLLETEWGRKIVRDAAKKFLEDSCRKCQQLRPYPKVLVVARRLGLYPGFEVFREPGVNVRMEEMIDIPDIADVGGIADELLIAQLPRPWKRLVECDACYRAGEVFRGITAERQIESILGLRWLRELHEWRLDAAAKGE